MTTHAKQQRRGAAGPRTTTPARRGRPRRNTTPPARIAMAVVAGEEEEWRQWQRATMGVMVLDDIDDDDCDGAMDCDSVMDGDYEDNDSDDNVVAQTPAHR